MHTAFWIATHNLPPISPDMPPGFGVWLITLTAYCGLAYWPLVAVLAIQALSVCEYKPSRSVVSFVGVPDFVVYAVQTDGSIYFPHIFSLLPVLADRRRLINLNVHF